MRLSTVLGWDTTSDRVNPRKPVVGASPGAYPHLVAQTEGGGVEGVGGRGVGHLEGDGLEGRS